MGFVCFWLISNDFASHCSFLVRVIMAAEGHTVAALDHEAFLREVERRCLDRVVCVRQLRRGFKLYFYKSPDNPTKCRSMDPLSPRTSFLVSQVVLSEDGVRAVGRTNVEDDQGNRLWVNLRSRFNAEGLLRPTWYVDEIR